MARLACSLHGLFKWYLLKPKQIQRIIKAVDYFVNDNSMDVDVRFDIIAIVLNKKGMSLEHLEDAFYHF